jgi:hypothetical protein
MDVIPGPPGIERDAPHDEGQALAMAPEHREIEAVRRAIDRGLQEWTRRQSRMTDQEMLTHPLQSPLESDLITPRVDREGAVGALEDELGIGGHQSYPPATYSTRQFSQSTFPYSRSPEKGCS